MKVKEVAMTRENVSNLYPGTVIIPYTSMAIIGNNDKEIFLKNLHGLFWWTIIGWESTFSTLSFIAHEPKTNEYGEITMKIDVQFEYYSIKKEDDNVSDHFLIIEDFKVV